MLLVCLLGCCEDGKVIKEPTYSLEDVNPTFIGEYYKQSTSYELDLFTNK